MTARTFTSYRASGFAVLALIAWPTLMGAEGCDPTDPPTVCPTNWDPVCGVDDVTYGNTCAADAARVLIAYDGECGGGCVCPEIYAPVCGSDGITYENECTANCAGAMAAHPGACECAPVLCDLYCEGGFERDPMTGCETCRCTEPDPTCVIDADCGMGTYCDTSECWGMTEPGCLPPDPTDPMDPTLPVCLGICRPIAPPPPAWCTSDAECGPGARCDLIECVDVCAEDGACFTQCHGVCVGEPPPSDRCLADSDCLMGERCNTDECYSLCDPMSPDMACPAVCAGVCEPAIDPPPPPSSCASDADCAESDHCELYWCMGPPCASDDPMCIVSDCGGACVPDAPPDETCVSDAECGAFQVCTFPVCIMGEDCPTDGVCIDTATPAI